MMRVGFVGLGDQGGPMARRIIEAGYPTTLWARRPATLEPFAGPQAGLAGTRAELGTASDVLCVCVVDDAGVGDVLRGTEGALSAMAPGSVAVVHSTVHPATCVRLQQDFPAIHVVDAPVSGGGARAANGELLVMAGGAPEVVDRCRPLFETYANLVVHLGEISAGLEAKLLNNTLFAAHLAVAAEVHAIASDLGLDHQALATAVAHGSGRSYAAELVARVGFRLDALAGTAGPLLAKDVGILADVAAVTRSPLLDAAEAALERMGVPQIPDEDA
jgi:3-hydroxyisobutyrate dehydrogenase